VKTDKKILITGGTGFIGSNLTDYFLNHGFKVVIIDNLLTSTTENIPVLKSPDNFIFINGDVIQEETFTQLKNEYFDIIYHLASPASPKQYIKYPLETLLANSLGTINVIKYLMQSRSDKMIYASTSEIYGDPLEHPQRETYFGNVNPVGLRSCYDESKRFGETACMTFFQKNKIDIRIARIFNTYGPNMEKNDGRVISNFIVQALSNQDITVYGSGYQTRSFCYISDLVAGLVALSKPKLSGQIINLGNNDEQRIIDIAREIKKITHSQSKITYKSLPIDDPKRRKPDLKKASDILHWSPETKLSTGLKLTIEYFKTRFAL